MAVVIYLFTFFNFSWPRAVKVFPFSVSEGIILKFSPRTEFTARFDCLWVNLNEQKSHIKPNSSLFPSTFRNLNEKISRFAAKLRTSKETAQQNQKVIVSL